MSAILPLTNLVNRRQKRKFKSEALNVALHLERVNTGFIWHIFNGPKDQSYKEIYIYYLDEWNKTVKTIVKNKRLEHAAIDILFFEREYKPELFIK